MGKGTQSIELVKSAKEIQANIIIRAEDKPRLLTVWKKATESCAAFRSNLLCSRQNDSVMGFFLEGGVWRLVVTNMQNIWQKSLKKHTSVSLLTASLLPGFHASGRDGKTSPFTHCPLCTAQGQPLGLVPSQGKPCSTQWLRGRNCCWFLPCHLPETFSYVEHLFPSFLFGSMVPKWEK